MSCYRLQGKASLKMLSAGLQGFSKRKGMSGWCLAPPLVSPYSYVSFYYCSLVPLYKIQILIGCTATCSPTHKHFDGILISSMQNYGCHHLWKTSFYINKTDKSFSLETEILSEMVLYEIKTF